MQSFTQQHSVRRRSIRGKLTLLVLASVGVAVTLVTGVLAWRDGDRETRSTLDRFSSIAKVTAAMAGQTFKAPSGITSMMDPKNHHLHKAVFIGEVKADGQFNVVWKTPGPIKAQPWSPFIAGNDKKKDEPDLTAKK